jgi:diguanylate cyclase (GGDEF)-like protein
MLTLYELARALAGLVSFSDAGDVIAKHLRRLVPSTLTVFYAYEPATAELEARHAVGDGASAVRGLRIELGQRLSGWVAAHRQTIVNSDPVLDLGDVAKSSSLILRSCLSAPLILGDELVGVLALYSTELNAFTEDHRRIVDVVATQIAHTFRRSIEFDSTVRGDALTGLPDLKQLERLVQSANDGRSPYALLFVDIIGLNSINERYGRQVGDEVLRHVSRGVRSTLRVADILFRYKSDEFIAFLSGTEVDTANGVSERIAERFAGSAVPLPNGDELSVAVTTCVALPDQDGRSLSDLIAAARVKSSNSQPAESLAP